MNRRIIDSDSEGESDEEGGLFVSPSNDSPVRVDESRFTPAPSEQSGEQSEDPVTVAVPQVTHPSQYQFVGASQVSLPEPRTGQANTSTQSTSQSHNEPSPPPSPQANQNETGETSQANKAGGPVIPDSQTITISDSPTTVHVTDSDTTDRRDFGASERSGTSSKVSGSTSRVPHSSAAEPRDTPAKPNDGSDDLIDQPDSRNGAPTTSAASPTRRDNSRSPILAPTQVESVAAPLQKESPLPATALSKEPQSPKETRSNSIPQAVEAVKPSAPPKAASPTVRPSQATTASETQHPQSQNPVTGTSIEDLQSQIPYDPSTQLPDLPLAIGGRASQSASQTSIFGQTTNVTDRASSENPQPHHTSLTIGRQTQSQRPASSGTSRVTPLKELVNHSQAQKSDRSTFAAFSSLSRAPSRPASVTPDSRLPARPHTPSSAMSSRPSSPSVRSTHGADLKRKLQDIWKDKGHSSTRTTPSKLASTENTPAPQSSTSARRPSPADSNLQQSPLVSMNASKQSPSASQMPPPQSAEISSASSDARNYYCFLPLDDDSKDIYRSVFGSDDPGARNREVIKRKGQQLLDICDHVDLLQGDVEATQATQAMGPETQVDWSVSTSSKFAFLRALIDDSDNISAHVALFVKPRLLDLLELFLKGSTVRYNRPDRKSSSGQERAGLRFTLMTTGIGAADLIVDRADLIIAFDSSFDHHKPEIKAARRQLHSNEMCPCISLIIPYSLEHIIRLHKDVAGDPDHAVSADDVFLAKEMLPCVGRIASANKEADNQPCPSAAFSADLVLRQLAKARDASWEDCLPKLRSLPDLPGQLPEAESKKRAAEPMDAPKSKRPRFEAPAVDLTSTSLEASTAGKNMDVTPWTSHSSGQMDRPHTVGASLPSNATTQNRPAGQPVLPSQRPDQSVSQPASQASTLSTTTKAPLPQQTTASTNPDTQTLRAETHRLKQHITGLETGLATAQSRYETRNTSLELALKDLRTRSADLTTLQTRLDTATTTITHLRTQRSAQADELETLRAAAKNGEAGLPAQELEDLRAKARRVDALEKSLASSKQDAEYFRTQYQSASSNAAAHASEIAELEAALAEARRKANTEARKLAQMRNLEVGRRERKDAERHRAETEQLRLELQRVSGAKKAAEEELEVEKSRRGMAATTRSASLPPGAVVGASAKGATSMAGVAAALSKGASTGVSAKKRLGGLLDVGGAGVRGGVGMSQGGAGNARRGATVSANTSRAVSPAAVGRGGEGSQSHAKTSPLQRTVALNE